MVRSAVRGLALASLLAFGCAREPCPEVASGPVVRLDRGLETCNERPVAKISGPVDIVLHQVVELVATGSSDGNSDTLTYAWTLEESPEGSSAQVDSEGDRVSFTVDRLGTYAVRLEASDGELTNEVTWSLTAINHPPTANAGVDRTAELGERVTLDGSASADLEGDALTFAWTLEVPTTSTTALDDPTSVAPSFTADTEGVFEATLVVSDGELESEAAVIRIGVALPGSAPIADAGSDQLVNIPAVVRLNGAASRDPDRDPLTYAWRVLESPVGSTPTLSDSSSVAPSLNVDLVGVYIVELTVDDGFRRSVPDTVRIDAEETLGPILLDPASAYRLWRPPNVTGGGFGIAEVTMADGAIGFQDIGEATVLPDGRLVYEFRGVERGLKIFVPDGFRFIDGARLIPSDPERNDPTVVTPACATTLKFFVVPDTSEVLLDCPGGVVDSAGNVRFAAGADESVLAAGYRGTMLTAEPEGFGHLIRVYTSTGAAQVFRVNTLSLVAPRAVDDSDGTGFLLIVDPQVSNGETRRLLRRFNVDGTSSDRLYPPIPSDRTFLGRGAILPNGDLITFLRIGSERKLFRFTPTSVTDITLPGDEQVGKGRIFTGP